MDFGQRIVGFIIAQEIDEDVHNLDGEITKRIAFFSLHGQQTPNWDG